MADVHHLFNVDPLPPFVDPAALRASAAEDLLPPRRMRVSEAAARFRELETPTYTGPWDNGAAPYMMEPQDLVSSRAFEAVVFVGPAQSLKTASLIVNPLVHAATCDPIDTMIVHMSQSEARDFSIREIDRLNRLSPAVAKMLSSNKNEDNVHDKLYRGWRLTIMWPTITALSGKAIPRVLLTDYDRMPEDVGGDGEPFFLARKRTQSFGSRGMVVAESSPSRPILSADWRPSTPHEAPPTTGILALYGQGDRRRLYWPCPHCGEYFEGAFSDLRWPDGVPIDEAAEQVVMLCPCCGEEIASTRQKALTAASRWLREGETIDTDGVISGEPRKAKIASFWLKGTAAAFQTWPSLVRNYLNAKETFQKTGAENGLKTTVNVDQGEAYLPAALARRAAGSLTASALVEQAEDYPLRVVPAWARFLVASADTQGNRWDCMVRAVGPGLESAVIDHFQIYRPADPAEDRMVSPALYERDWTLLRTELMANAYPLAAAPDHVMTIALTVVDSQGEKGVTTKAYEFWRRCAADRIGGKVLLYRGDPSPRRPRLIITWPDSQRKDRHAGARGEVPVGIVNSNPIKDDIDAGLRRTEGPGRIHLPLDLRSKDTAGNFAPPHEFFEQIAAEVRGDNGTWVKKRERNEALDLLVMTHVALLRLRADRILDWDRPAKAWALPWQSNPLVMPANAVRPDLAPRSRPSGTAPVTNAVRQPAPAPTARPAQPVQRTSRRSSYIGR